MLPHVAVTIGLNEVIVGWNSYSQEIKKYYPTPYNEQHVMKMAFYF